MKLQQTLQQFKSNQEWTTTVFTSKGSRITGTVSKMRCPFWSTVRLCGTLRADIPLSHLFTKNLIKILPVNVHFILNKRAIRQFLPTGSRTFATVSGFRADDGRTFLRPSSRSSSSRMNLLYHQKTSVRDTTSFPSTVSRIQRFCGCFINSETKPHTRSLLHNKNKKGSVPTT